MGSSHQIAITLVAGLLITAPDASAQVKLYWTATDASGAYVIRANADGSNPTAIVSGSDEIRGPNGLEYFNGVLYWPDQQLNAVRQVKPDGSDAKTFVDALNPYDVFATSERGFWSSQDRGYIDTQLLGGTDYQRLFDSSIVTRPYAIDVTASHVYWSEVSGSGKIRRSDLDGANVITLIPNVFVYDLQVTPDFIYFADNNFPGGIKRANLDGSQITPLVSTGALYNGLHVTADALYWSAFLDGDGGGVRRANLDGTNPVNLYNSPAGTSVRGIVALPDVPTVPEPRFTNYQIGPESVTLTLEVEPQQTYRIETSGDLSGWTETTNLVSNGTTLTFTNAVSAGTRILFFRARTP
ncbi:MAG TPA: DUF5050 domain-containing protein [Verrucomicrobiota bacterium]|nr:DUF5050 domain-containing protein [Verrucomicrobiota bacterium]